MIRTNVSRTTTVRETATHMGHQITFNYEIPDGQTRPTSVSAQARKIDEANGNQPMVMGNITVTVGAVVNTNYPPATPGELIGAIKAECLNIINGEAE